MAKGQTSQWKSSQQCNNATIKQSNKLLPIQLVSLRNNDKNEVMLPKQNSYFYDTMAAQNPQKYIFESSNYTVDSYIMSIRLHQLQRIYFYVPQLYMLL